MRLKKIALFSLFLLFLGIGAFYFYSDKLTHSREQCTAIGIQKYHQKVFWWDSSGERKKMKGIKKYGSPIGTEQKKQLGEIRDLKLVGPNKFYLLWWYHDSKIKANSFLYLDQYKIENGKAMYEKRVWTDTGAGLANMEELIKPRGEFFVEEFIGRTGIYTTQFYYPGDNKQFREFYGRSMFFIEASEDFNFILNRGAWTDENGYHDEVYINNSPLYEQLQKRGFDWKKFKRKDFWNPGVKWWDESFWFLLVDNRLVKITPELTDEEAEIKNHYIPRENLEKFPESVQKLNNIWKKKVTVDIQKIPPSESGLPSYDPDNHKLLLRRSLNRLYLLVYLTPEESRREILTGLYRIHEDGTVTKVTKNRDIKIKGLKDGDRRMYCDHVKYLKLWDWEWKLPAWLQN